MKSFIKSFISALGFLSILPTGRKTLLENHEFGRFPSVFPLVGLVLGLILWGFQVLCGQFLPHGALAVFTLTLLIVLNRGFHLDGLADAADALFSHKSLEQKLAIMKDSRQGTFGVLAIVLDVLLKLELLKILMGSESSSWSGLFLLWPMWGRLAASVTAVRSEYVRQEGGLGRFIVEESKPRDLAAAVVIAVLASLPFGWTALTVTLAVLIFGLALTWVWRQLLGGLTGDLLGATVELGEIFALLLLAALVS